ncbi:regulator of chromosome condensation, RCC1, partial [Candidatus Magnetobacterium bavaricum]
MSVTGLTTVRTIAGGKYHTIMLKDDGNAWTWGKNTNGQLGDNTTTQRTTPVLVVSVYTITPSAGTNGTITPSTPQTV